MFLCQKCGRISTPNHHFEFDINDLVRQYAEADVRQPTFKIGNFEGKILGCHVERDNIYIHIDHWRDGLLDYEERCQLINIERAKYVISRMKNRLKAMILLKETKTQCEDVCRLILDKFRGDGRYYGDYCDILENGWTHLKYDALGDIVRDEQLTKSQIQKIQTYAKKLRKGEK